MATRSASWRHEVREAHPTSWTTRYPLRREYGVWAAVLRGANGGRSVVRFKSAAERQDLVRWLCELGASDEPRAFFVGAFLGAVALAVIDTGHHRGETCVASQSRTVASQSHSSAARRACEGDSSDERRVGHECRSRGAPYH